MTSKTTFFIELFMDDVVSGYMENNDPEAKNSDTKHGAYLPPVSVTGTADSPHPVKVMPFTPNSFRIGPVVSTDAFIDMNGPGFDQVDFNYPYEQAAQTLSMYKNNVKILRNCLLSCVETDKEIIHVTWVWKEGINLDSVPDNITDEYGFLVNEIQKWNTENIEVLKLILGTLKDIAEDDKRNLADLIDIYHLPTKPIPADVDIRYPIWAMDENGYCLVGENMDTIEHIEEIKKTYMGRL